ncbi:MAG: polyprenyl diphosphate synthase, partial [Paraclostridium sp.]
LHSNDEKITTIGDIDVLPSKSIEAIKNAINTTKENNGLNLNIALNYGSRNDIKNAVIDIVKNCKSGKIDIEDINEDIISNYLSTKSIPDPDLIIRTSGEQRISNFLLWEIAYSEFYFTDTYWPDFNENEVRKAIYVYQSRDRRFGGLK